jgi:glycosyltransferase involved in cell wall biosynthesis
VKILLVHNTYQQPGGEDVVFHQERTLLEKAGHEVIAYQRSNFEVDRYTGLRRLDLAKRTIWASDTKREFSRLLRREQPELVHVHNTFVMISPSIYSACSEAGIPAVQTLHNFRLLCPDGIFFRDGHVCEECHQGSLWHSIQHACYQGSRAATAVVAGMLEFHRLRDTWKREVSQFISLTEFARQKFIAGGFPADRITVKPNFVDPDPGEQQAKQNYALLLGRLAPGERVRTTLKAWKLLQADLPLVIIGGGPNQAELEAEAGQLGLKNISFRGQQPRAEALAALKAARFLLFPSEWYEGFPMTLAESFACGTPVICSRLGAMQEIVADGVTGLQFGAGDAAELASKVEWACAHPAEMRAMGQNARREFEAKYTAEKNYPQLLEIYQRALQGAPKRGKS